LVGVLLGVAVMVGVRVCVGVNVGDAVGVSVSRSVGIGVILAVSVGLSGVGGGVTGGVSKLEKTKNRTMKKMMIALIDKTGFLETKKGKLLKNFLRPVIGITGSGALPSAASSLFKAVSYSSLTKST